MFDIGWTEMLVIAIVMIVVVGPKDLPKMLRTFGRTTAKMRGMAADFQKQFNDALKEAELDDVKKSVDSLRSLNPAAEIRKQLNPFEQAAADVRSGVDAVMKPKPAADPVAASTPQDTELNNGATVLPGVDAPEAAPAAPTFPAMTDGSVTPPVATATPAASPKASAAKTEGAPAKAMPASKAAAKPAAKPAVTKTAAKKAEPKPAPATVKKPATAAKKTAGAAK
ncbi:Sec-independent protein translocase protein TatB [Mesorhizobium muleiense]|uniref:Sec-independent protein translocase protein TatB n=1 Tax=Mesorhizobium muleiense TaxID=1004279 RepID=A0A1G9BML2_9HYPH|nr:Sec-independent protein translocase protein TatB [Mesorhizobium muleiense]MCF6103781.1 Sec-independent protein translocase protein TatB [Mesorhizobium muleiense]SDK40643.1 sec-independent protein translocase protein TatB [Mesorhizobium muleiense]